MADPAHAADKPDYRDTVFLPQTDFPMRAGLPKKEPEILARWAEMGLYGAMRRARQEIGAPLYVLHDGPPYANGPIHIGHALNKILKDFVVRSRFLLGYDVDYVPGWDCHGLPIEWKIEEEVRREGRRKEDVPRAEFRERCREFAARWIDVQRVEFERLGILGAWDDRYATMDFATEARIVAEFHKFLMSGQLYRGSKPVMWSPVERTALAEAEVEYHDHVSPTIWVKFPIAGRDGAAGGLPSELDGAFIVIWTTTPWTIPGNRAITYNSDIAYGLYEVEAMEADLPFEPWAAPGQHFAVADRLAEEVRAAARIASWRRIGDMDPAGLVCRHPLAALAPDADDKRGYGFAVPLLPGAHVTEDAGTGFVHTAPGHGHEDYVAWLGAGRRDIPDTVDPDGAYYPDVPLFGGLKVLETEGKKAGKFGPANDAVIGKLIEAGNLLARGRLSHSYPHSWRSKAPVIYRNTPQWFIRMDTPIEGDATLRERALAAIGQTAFHPPQGRNRIGAMVEGRPDWLISRQRAWGTPLAMFVDKISGEPLRDAAVNARIQKVIAAEGADAWFTRPASDFLDGRDPEQFEKIDDILDVWFDSGSTHAFTLEGRPDSRWPADLYLEGSDQHRGWFQSSLLESCGTRGRAPYNAVLTHGFTLDEKGEKMSKSLGNSVEPQTVIKDSGAEILRLWVAMVDYAEDQRIGQTILQTTVDSYRKLRNTIRYLLGGLAGFAAAERLAPAAMPELDRLVLHRLWELDSHVRAAYEGYRFHDVWRPVAEFCTNDLSAFYFDIRRDMLYCDPPESERRRACRTVMDLCFERLTAWLAPLACFTMEEAWAARFPDAPSNSLRIIPDTPADWRDDALAARWERIRDLRRAITGALEIERREKRIGASLEAVPEIYVADDADYRLLAGIDLAEIAITSGATLIAGAPPAGAFILPEMPGIGVVVRLAEGQKCARCWQILPEVGSERTDLCLRCTAAVDGLRGQAA